MWTRDYSGCSMLMKGPASNWTRLHSLSYPALMEKPQPQKSFNNSVRNILMKIRKKCPGILKKFLSILREGMFYLVSKYKGKYLWKIAEPVLTAEKKLDMKSPCLKNSQGSFSPGRSWKRIMADVSVFSVLVATAADKNSMYSSCWGKDDGDFLRLKMKN